MIQHTLGELIQKMLKVLRDNQLFPCDLHPLFGQGLLFLQGVHIQVQLQEQGVDVAFCTAHFRVCGRLVGAVFVLTVN